MTEDPTRTIRKDTIHVKVESGCTYVISENYFYKTDTYYHIVQSEVEGTTVVPSSAEVIEAYVVPLCLEKAKRAGIPVCSWEISYVYAPIPSIVYGLNYFSDPADYIVLNTEAAAPVVIKHITNKLKYPFCYQKIEEGAAVITVTAIFGRTTVDDEEIAKLADACYRVFRMPLVNIVLVSSKDGYLLSALTPLRYSQLTKEDRRCLEATLAEDCHG